MNTVGVFASSMDRLAEMESWEDILFSINHGHIIEMYVVESVQYRHLVPRDDQSLIDLFWIGLDQHILQLIPPGNTTLSLRQYIDWVLWIYGSPVTVGEVSEMKNNDAAKQLFSDSQSLPMHQSSSSSTKPVTTIRAKPPSCQDESAKPSLKRSAPVSIRLASKLEDFPIMSIRRVRRSRSRSRSISNKESLSFMPVHESASVHESFPVQNYVPVKARSSLCSPSNTGSVHRAQSRIHSDLRDSLQVRSSPQSSVQNLSQTPF